MGLSWKLFVDEDEVRKALSIFKPDNQLFEIRILKEGSRRKQISSGYFKDPDKFFEKLDTFDLRQTNIYFSLGYLNEALYSRSQRDTLRQVSQTTSDNEVDGYQWFFVDLDPVRPTGISSSDSELKKAEQKATTVRQYLEDIGFEEPIVALSGNGYHLLYKISMENTPENVATIEGCLKTLSEMFDDDDVKIDTTNYNPARICKLHGTLAQKGADSPERPHRMSRILTVPQEIRKTHRVYLEKLAGETMATMPTRRAKPGTQYKKFDVEEWLNEHGIAYTDGGLCRDGVILNLDECPFDSNHRNGDAKIFRYSNGAISFKCHHNSCQGKTWEDVRLKFEPDAYSKPEFDDRFDKGWREHNRNKQKPMYEEQLPSTDYLKIFRTASEILQDPEPEYEYIKTGILTIDNLMAGLAKTELTAISGLTGSGKSTLLSQIMLNAIDNGHRVVCYSGEMSNKKYLNWMIRQAAGKTNTVASEKLEEEYLVKSTSLQQKIATWMGDLFRLYDNRQGNDFKKIRDALGRVLVETKADLCVIDNLMILDLDMMDKDRYEAQKKFVVSLKDLALKTNTHILFVAHPRKSQGWLRLSDIAGSANIGNILDNGFVVHRCNTAFEKAYREEFGESPYTAFFDEPTNVIEIVKDREHGHTSRIIPLYYEKETKRLKNSLTENFVYGWQEDRI